MSPATTAGELVRKLKKAQRNIIPSILENLEGNDSVDASLHRQHWRPHCGKKNGKTKHSVYCIYGMQM